MIRIPKMISDMKKKKLVVLISTLEMTVNKRYSEKSVILTTWQQKEPFEISVLIMLQEKQ
jgi:hypothetical protein